ncbi:MAG: hypothetical protein F4Y02_01920 [Chloroflexi bacterium]|nr:hypothetical protein [Chloroflexota bacterium]
MGRIINSSGRGIEGGDNGFIRFDGAVPDPVYQVGRGAEELADVTGAGLDRAGVAGQELGPNAGQRAPVPRVAAPSRDHLIHWVTGVLAIGRLRHDALPQFPPA